SSVRCVWFRISQSLRRALHVWLTLRRPKQRNANPLLGPVAFVLASAAVGATSGACQHLFIASLGTFGGVSLMPLSTVESLYTKRANHRLVASSIMLISNVSSPR